MFYLAMQQVSPAWQVKNGVRLTLALLALYLPKLAQEYALHALELPP